MCNKDAYGFTASRDSGKQNLVQWRDGLSQSQIMEGKISDFQRCGSIVYCHNITKKKDSWYYVTGHQGPGKMSTYVSSSHLYLWTCHNVKWKLTMIARRNKSTWHSGTFITSYQSTSIFWENIFPRAGICDLWQDSNSNKSEIFP
jgi:hypothetical protein